MHAGERVIIPVEPYEDPETGVQKMRWALVAEKGEGTTAERDWYEQMRAIFVNAINLGLSCETRVQLWQDYDGHTLEDSTLLQLSQYADFRIATAAPCAELAMETRALADEDEPSRSSGESTRAPQEESSSSEERISSSSEELSLIHI